MDLLLTGEDQSQADQANTLAEGHPPHVSNQILWMFFFLWLVFTSRLSSQTTWLKVKPYCKFLNIFQRNINYNQTLD